MPATLAAVRASEASLRTRVHSELTEQTRAGENVIVGSDGTRPPIASVDREALEGCRIQSSHHIAPETQASLLVPWLYTASRGPTVDINRELRRPEYAPRGEAFNLCADHDVRTQSAGPRMVLLRTLMNVKGPLELGCCQRKLDGRT